MMGAFATSLLVQLLGTWLGLDYMETITQLEQSAPLREKNFIKTALGLSHIMTFIIPALIFLWGVYKRDWWRAMKLTKLPSGTKVFLACLLLSLSFPLIQYIFYLNKQLPLPTWAIEQENIINQTVNHLLYVGSTWELGINIFIIALLPALGEELVFRGIVQQRFEKTSANKHIAIWMTALLFSFIHFQFQGFFPRLLLGALLGYLFIWTRNLWLPIIAHFFYNAGQIILQYLNQQKALSMNLNEIEVVPMWLVISSLVATAFVAFALVRESRGGDEA
jgi:membrane protease YdiL (CAAX protease family)